jgi:cytochrome c oxidase subunit 4
VVKALLVVLFFMHLVYARRVVGLVAAAAFFWLAILFSFTLADYLSRDWLGHPLPGLTGTDQMNEAATARHR